MRRGGWKVSISSGGWTARVKVAPRKQGEKSVRLYHRVPMNCRLCKPDGRALPAFDVAMHKKNPRQAGVASTRAKVRSGSGLCMSSDSGYRPRRLRLVVKARHCCVVGGSIGGETYRKLAQGQFHADRGCFFAKRRSARFMCRAYTPMMARKSRGAPCAKM